MARITSRIQQASAPVKRPPGTEHLTQIRDRAKQPLPAAKHVEELPEDVAVDYNELAKRRVGKYITIDVASTKGKVYRITVPHSYEPYIPKVWSWTPDRLKAAELLASGFPVRQVVQDPDIGLSSRHIIYAWLQHPEFKEHVDALIMETGFASQRERIAGLTRLTQKLFDRVIDSDHIPLTDKSIGSLLTGIMQGLKQLGQEKGEFVEHQSIEQQTTLSGGITTKVEVGDVLESRPEAERAALAKEFDNVGDSVIRQLTGGK